MKLKEIIKNLENPVVSGDSGVEVSFLTSDSREVKEGALVVAVRGGVDGHEFIDKAIEQGATEIDMVMNIGRLKSKNHVAVLKDISNVKRAIGLIPLKVILEISELSKNEIVKACEICIDARADFVKTSTGFSKSGATLTAVKIMKKSVKDQLKIKASGGIRDAETALKYIEVGVHRIGASSGVAMMTNQTSLSSY